MRSLSSDTTGRTTQPAGEEPIVVIQLIWPDDDIRWYADRDDVDIVPAQSRIVSVSPARMQISSDNLGTVGSMRVVLSDNDEELRAILNSKCVYKIRAAVLHYFIGGDEMVMLLDGKVQHPIVWKEDTRTLEFDIVSAYEGEDALCKSEDNEEFPLVFGSVLDVPAAQDTVPPKGSVLGGFDHDETTFYFEVEEEGFTEGSLVTLDVGGEWLTGVVTIDDGIATVVMVDRNVVKWSLNSSTINDMTENQQVDLRYAPFVITNERLPGNWITIVSPNAGTSNYCLYQKGNITRCQLAWFIDRPKDIGYVVQVRKYPPNQGYWTHNEGTVVREVGKAAKYVFNCAVDSTVRAVKGRKDDEWVTVPEAWYVVKNRTVNEQSVSGIVFATPLALQGFDSNDILVSVNSSLDDNTAEVVRFLIEQKTDLIADTAAFDAVAVKLENYPSRFAVTSQVDALKLAADIAWQARCGLYTIGSTVFMVYLSEEPDTTASLALNDTNILEGSPEFTYSENIVTRFTAKWRKTPDGEEQEIIVENNIDVFDLHEGEFNFFIYDRKSLVQKSVDFWAPQYSNVWTVVKLGAMMDVLGTDIYDYVNLTLDLIVSGSVRALLQLVEYNTEVKSFSLLLWTPVKCGENTETNIWLEDDDEKPPVRPVEDVPFVDEVTAEPIDLSWVNPLGTATGIGETDGVFQAENYTGAEQSAPVIEARRLGDWQINEGDEVFVGKLPNGELVGFKAGGAPIMYQAYALEDENSQSFFDAEITMDLAGSVVYKAVQQVGNMGDDPVVEGDFLPLWRMPSGEWAVNKAETAGGSAIPVKVRVASTDRNNVRIDVYEDGARADPSQEDVTAKMIGTLATGATIPANTWAIGLYVAQEWWVFIPVYLPFVA